MLLPFLHLPPQAAAADELARLLPRWVECGWLRALDAAFAGLLRREVPDAAPALLLAAALASHQLGRGQVCLDLAATLADPDHALSFPPDGSEAEALHPDEWPQRVLQRLDLASWRAALADARLVGVGEGATPLVLAGNRLYLRRYWRYEQSVRAGLAARLGAPLPLPQARVRAALDALFPLPPTADATAPDWQKAACALAARARIAIITGGPGTGKTTTVVRLLALLQGLTLAAGATPLRISLAAPTGKAAARLNTSIVNAVGDLQLTELTAALGMSAHPGTGDEDAFEALRAAIPTTVGTLHRLLGARPDTRRMRHDADTPLALDVLVIDEASMVDLEMMAAVLVALPPHARLVLLGDKDQLASVEAGAVLGELCQRAAGAHYTPATVAWLEQAAGVSVPPALQDAAGTPLDQVTTMLRHSHRFDASGGIGQLAAAVNVGDGASGWRILHAADAAVSNLLLPADPAARRNALAALVLDGGAELVAHRRGYRHYLRVMHDARPPVDAPAEDFDTWAAGVLLAQSHFQVLSPLRGGSNGVVALNVQIAGVLRAARLIEAVDGWYPGRPVLVTRNDHALGVMNGDIGVTLTRPDGRGGWTLRVAFASATTAGGVKWVLPARLADVETVFALTVHKSQGSEFDHVALVLPTFGNPLLTRELIYTGLTRAARFVTVAHSGSARIWQEAVAARILRASGLLAEPLPQADAVAAADA